MLHISLPMDIEEFLENHIMSLQGASLIRSAVNIQTIEPLPILVENVTISTQIVENVDNMLAYISNDCPLCNKGDLPMQNRAHKCIICGLPVHALSPLMNFDKKKEEYAEIVPRLKIKLVKAKKTLLVNIGTEKAKSKPINHI